MRLPAVRAAVATYRHDVRTGLLLTGVVTLLGVPAGLLWVAVAPEIDVVVRGHAVYLTNPEDPGFIATDGWFAVIGAVTGLLTAALAFLAWRGRGVAAVLGLAAGGLLASLLAWRLGHQLGPGGLSLHAAGAAQAASRAAPLELRALGVLFAWPMSATTLFLALTASFETEPPPRDEPAGRGPLAPEGRL
ncbi:MAG: hypothetical protein ACRDPK_09690 [Carbonactinosporaceae bacterium]